MIVDSKKNTEEEAVEHLAILFQRRYNVLRDIKKATDELSEALGRKDTVSVDLMLQIRGDYLVKCDESWQEISVLPEDNEIYRDLFPRLVFPDPDKAEAHSRMEQKLLEIRSHCRQLIKTIQDEDRILNLRTNRDRSIFS